MCEPTSSVLFLSQGGCVTGGLLIVDWLLVLRGGGGEGGDLLSAHLYSGEK